MKKILFLPIVLSLMLFNSCQEEGIEIIQDTADEILVANSTVASLMQRTVTRDGSYDNIIDNASCIDIVLPVTVFVNGLEIIVDSEEDFEVIEAIFDQFEDDDDLLEIIFPITIVLSDHREIVIQNQAQLEEFIAECHEDDDDIECVDFQYPITYSVFDTEDNVITTVTIHNDEEMYRFLEEIDVNDIIGLNFPITLEFFDGEEVIVHNLTELEEVLDRAENYCDEDDDNDYGDDDFTIERLNELLVICPWTVHSVRLHDDETDEYDDYALLFEEDGTVKARRSNGEIVDGTWTTRDTDHGVALTLSFDNLSDFTLEWYVDEIEYGKIKLHAEGGNRIILKKNCDIIFDQTIDRIENILKECIWRIHRLRIDNVEHERQYIGTPLKFENDSIVKLRINGEFVSGKWFVAESNPGFALQMTFDDRPELNLYWMITVLEDHKVKLENQDSEMILKRVCQNDDVDVIEINALLIEGEWIVAYFEEDGINETETFSDNTLDFKETGRVIVSDDIPLYSGSWLTYRNDGLLKLGLNFGDNYPFEELNNRWKILEVSENRIELIDFGSTGNIEKKLVLEK